MVVFRCPPEWVSRFRYPCAVHLAGIRGDDEPVTPRRPGDEPGGFTRGGRPREHEYVSPRIMLTRGEWDCDQVAQACMRGYGW